MIPKINKILYATDLSENSQRAFTYAASLSERYEAQIIVLYVIEPIPKNTYMNIGGMMGESEMIRMQQGNYDRLYDEISTKIHRFCSSLQASEPACPVLQDNILIRKGVPVEEIINTATEKEADLIVLGTHGYGLVKDALMGGTVRRVLRRSKIPVLVARNLGSEASG